jgi:hypothetical protein
MAYTCRDAVIRAYRLAGIRGVQREPTAAETDFAMEALRSLYSQWAFGGMFGKRESAYPGAYEFDGYDTTIDGQAMTIPTTDGDWNGSTWEAREGAAVIIPVGGVEYAYLYSGGQWLRPEGLTANHPAPLSQHGLQGLAACLAMEIHTPFMDAPRPAVVRAAAGFKQALRLKYGADYPNQWRTWVLHDTDFVAPDDTLVLDGGTP